MKAARALTALLALFTALALTYGASSFGVSSGGSISNPYYLYPTQNQVLGTEPFLDTAGRTPVSCALAAERTAVFIIVGQSLNANAGSDSYSASSAKNHQFNIYNGGCYQSKQPMLGTNISGGLIGTNTGFWPMRLVDKLIVTDNKYDRGISVPMALGGTTAGQWADNSAPPFMKDRFAAVGARLAAAGLTCTAILWGQGENDTLAGTSQAAYAASLATVITAARAAMPCPFFVAQETYINGVTSAAIRAAQAAAWNGTTVLQGPDMDTIPAGERYDNTHLNAAGAADAATLWEAKIIAGLGL